MIPLAVVIGCPDQPWLIQAFIGTGALTWLLGLCVLAIVVFERAQDRARRSREE